MAASQSQSQGQGQTDPHHRGEPVQRQRRPMCGACVKPIRLCLCGRLRSPEPLDTTVGVTVLQHGSETNHPLNSTRVARIGLRNLAIARVTDVNHRARFFLRTLDAAAAADASGRSDGSGEVTGGGLAQCDGEGLDSAVLRDGICGESNGIVSARCGNSVEMGSTDACADLGLKDVNPSCSSDGGGERLDLVDVPGRICSDLDGVACGLECDSNGKAFGFQKGKKKDGHRADSERPGSEATNSIGNSVVNAVDGVSENGVAYKVNGDLPHSLVEKGSELCMPGIGNCNGVCKENGEVGAAVGQGWTVKNMDKYSIAYTDRELRIDIERGLKPAISWMSRSPLGQAAVLNGFTVTKIQTLKSKLTGEVTEFEEFSITIPPKAALLFPCQLAVSIDASDCQVQHLIVLDGTWAKAQRMYHENPWLQLLPHVKLESDRVSLYKEVRQEPKAGCLSTIESLVVAMCKLGEDAEALENLLDVFGSMVADQRRCKEENWEQKLSQA